MKPVTHSTSGEKHACTRRNSGSASLSATVDAGGRGVTDQPHTAKPTTSTTGTKTTAEPISTVACCYADSTTCNSTTTAGKSPETGAAHSCSTHHPEPRRLLRQAKQSGRPRSMRQISRPRENRRSKNRNQASRGQVCPGSVSRVRIRRSETRLSYCGNTNLQTLGILLDLPSP